MTTYDPEDVFVRGCVPYLLGNEGELSNHPADRGGLTVFGITRRTYPNDVIWTLATLEQQRARAIEIYREDFWKRPRFTSLAVHAPRTAIKVFDMGVNPSPVRAARALQRALNFLRAGYRSPRSTPVVEDGVVGARETVPALVAELRRSRGETELLATLAYLHGERFWFVGSDGGFDDSDAVFNGGWMVRAHRVPSEVWT